MKEDVAVGATISGPVGRPRVTIKTVTEGT